MLRRIGYLKSASVRSTLDLCVRQAPYREVAAKGAAVSDNTNRPPCSLA
jgi:hypothetical protein